MVRDSMISIFKYRIRYQYLISYRNYERKYMIIMIYLDLQLSQFIYKQVISLFLMAKVDFVEKILDILQHQTEGIKWNQDQSEFQILNIEDFKINVLPMYFRHDKFSSFIRQLNMYGFHKINRRKGAYIFKHDSYRKGDKNGLQLIKKAKKRKGAASKSIQRNSYLQEQALFLKKRAPNLGELLNKLIKFNNHSQFDHKALKSKLETLSKQVSAKKSRTIRPIISNLRENIAMMDQIQKKIKQLNWKSEQTPKKEKIQKQNLLLTETHPKSLKIMSSPHIIAETTKQTIERPELCSASMHLHSFPSISNFLV